jgi:tetratricopeptide (TPR) repeat protein
MNLNSASILLAAIVISSSIACGGNTIDDLIKEGWELIQVDLYSEAQEKFDEAISLNSSSPEAWHGKGFALNGKAYEKDDANEFAEARGYYEEAIRCFGKAIQLNSSYFDAYMDMSDSENRLDNYDKALELIDKAIAIEPNNAEAINVKGTIHYRMGEYDQALELFRKATTMDPNCANGWFNICSVLKEQGKGDPNADAEADVACQKAAAIYNANAGHK